MIVINDVCNHTYLHLMHEIKQLKNEGGDVNDLYVSSLSWFE